MIRYTRPPPPAEFARRVEMAAPDAELWREFKEAFRVAQHGKCGWCETRVIDHTGVVDHFAPKAAVGVLVAAGQEVGLAVEGRQTQPVHTPGYAWLALCWDNWLFCCERCNTGWKRTLFPVAERPHPQPAPGTPYTPLLLHPFEDPDPEEHLEFDVLGQVRAKGGSPRGAATVQTCGLDRESLRTARQQIVDDVEGRAETVIRLYDRPELADELDKAVQKLCDLCSGTHPYAAAARAAVQRVLGTSWTELERNWPNT